MLVGPRHRELMLICRHDGRSAILLVVSQAVIELVPCPTQEVRNALELVLRDLMPEQRRSIAAQLVGEHADGSPCDTLVVARRGNVLCGAAWGQLQPGKTAIFWVPQFASSTTAEVAVDLTRAVVRALDMADIEMTQALLPDRSAPIANTLESSGFYYLADLLYLSSIATSLSNASTESDGLNYVAYDGSKRERLIAILERTYEETLDCAAMNGKRQMDDVLDGYRASGVFRPENWLIVEREGQDVGVLLLAEDPAAALYELVYMGLVPEARGKGWGAQVARQAVRLASKSNAERVVLAVDAANSPALEMYGRAGFTAWDRRTVYVRFRGDIAL
jgi:ribosomal protein S18 acetylase RimI-like enzyme